MNRPPSDTPAIDRPAVTASPLKFWQRLGPGLITGAADDDPSGIATYSQAGARFGNSILPTVILTYPLMVAIQTISARLGRVTGHGLAGILGRHYPPWVLYGLVGALLIANTVNMAADLSAMGESAALLMGGPRALYAAGFGVLTAVLRVTVAYARYVRVLKWLTLSLFAYVGTLFILPIDWSTVLSAILLPQIQFDSEYLTTIVAVLVGSAGTMV